MIEVSEDFWRNCHNNIIFISFYYLLNVLLIKEGFMPISVPYACSGSFCSVAGFQSCSASCPPTTAHTRDRFTLSAKGRRNSQTAAANVLAAGLSGSTVGPCMRLGVIAFHYYWSTICTMHDYYVTLTGRTL